MLDHSSHSPGLFRHLSRQIRTRLVILLGLLVVVTTAAAAVFYYAPSADVNACQLPSSFRVERIEFSSGPSSGTLNFDSDPPITNTTIYTDSTSLVAKVVVSSPDNGADITKASLNFNGSMQTIGAMSLLQRVFTFNLDIPDAKTYSIAADATDSNGNTTPPKDGTVTIVRPGARGQVIITAPMAGAQIRIPAHQTDVRTFLSAEAQGFSVPIAEMTLNLSGPINYSDRIAGSSISTNQNLTAGNYHLEAKAFAGTNSPVELGQASISFSVVGTPTPPPGALYRLPAYAQSLLASLAVRATTPHAVAAQPAAPACVYKLTGFVRDENGIGIGGVKVTATGYKDDTPYSFTRNGADSAAGENGHATTIGAGTNVGKFFLQRKFTGSPPDITISKDKERNVNVDDPPEGYQPGSYQGPDLVFKHNNRDKQADIKLAPKPHIAVRAYEVDDNDQELNDIGGLNVRVWHNTDATTPADCPRNQPASGLSSGTTTADKANPLKVFKDLLDDGGNDQNIFNNIQYCVGIDLANSTWTTQINPVLTKTSNGISKVVFPLKKGYKLSVIAKNKDDEKSVAGIPAEIWNLPDNATCDNSDAPSNKQTGTTTVGSIGNPHLKFVVTKGTWCAKLLTPSLGWLRDPTDLPVIKEKRMGTLLSDEAVFLVMKAPQTGQVKAVAEKPDGNALPTTAGGRYDLIYVEGGSATQTGIELGNPSDRTRTSVGRYKVVVTELPSNWVLVDANATANVRDNVVVESGKITLVTFQVKPVPSNREATLNVTLALPEVPDSIIKLSLDTYSIERTLLDIIASIFRLYRIKAIGFHYSVMGYNGITLTETDDSASTEDISGTTPIKNHDVTRHIDKSVQIKAASADIKSCVEIEMKLGTATRKVYVYPAVPVSLATPLIANPQNNFVIKPKPNTNSATFPRQLDLSQLNIPQKITGASLKYGDNVKQLDRIMFCKLGMPATFDAQLRKDESDNSKWKTTLKWDVKNLPTGYSLRFTQQPVQQPVPPVSVITTGLETQAKGEFVITPVTRPSSNKITYTMELLDGDKKTVASVMDTVTFK